MPDTIAWAAALCLVAVAVTDWRWRTVPNPLVAALVGLFFLAWLVGDVAAPAAALAYAAAVLGVGAAAFAFGFVGGGDAKLLAATTLLAAPEHMVELIAVVAAAGGLLAIVLLAATWLPQRLRVLAGPVETGPPTVPYAVAIAVGGIWVLADRL